MARTVNNLEELWGGEDKVENLGDKEQQHGLAEVSKDPGHRKSHPSKITEGVSHKHTRGIPERRGEKSEGGRRKKKKKN